ncbi:hypothetical protein ASD52_20775 [Ensifer sp. Root142]|nr:hypothetical protein ASD52_20775 [Ensifer sp. Root142]KRC60071.1 hypothetical protein ASE32_13610 [Ensifer sp. Root231]OMQ45671.1 hypothetical protein BKP54_07185 [Ensifer sp. 1H6]
MGHSGVQGESVSHLWRRSNRQNAFRKIHRARDDEIDAMVLLGIGLALEGVGVIDFELRLPLRPEQQRCRQRLRFAR